MPTAHYMMRHDKTTIDKKTVMCRGLRHHTKRQNWALSQISSIVRSHTTRPDFCFVMSCRVLKPHVLNISVGLSVCLSVLDPHTLHDFPVRSCLVVSHHVRVMCGGNKMLLGILMLCQSQTVIIFFIQCCTYSY